MHKNPYPLSWLILGIYNRMFHWKLSQIPWCCSVWYSCDASKQYWMKDSGDKCHRLVDSSRVLDCQNVFVLDAHQVWSFQGKLSGIKCTYNFHHELLLSVVPCCQSLPTVCHIHDKRSECTCNDLGTDLYSFWRTCHTVYKGVSSHWDVFFLHVLLVWHLFWRFESILGS